MGGSRFRTLLLGVNKKALAHLDRVANSERHAKHVRSIRWETGHYYQPGFEYEDVIFVANSLWNRLKFSEDIDLKQRQQGHVITRLTQLAEEEQQLLGTNLKARLTNSFTKLTGLKNLVMETWRRRPGDLDQIWGR